MADRKYALIFELQNGEEFRVEFSVPQGEPGPPGDDYVLTPEDKTEIAEKAAGLVEVPEGVYIQNITIREV